MEMLEANQELLNSFLKKAGIPEKWYNVKFSDLKGSKEYLSQIKKIENWDMKFPPCLFLNGESGNGKTHISICLFKKFIWNKIIELYEDADDEDKKYCLNGKSFNYFIKESDLFARVYKAYDSKGYDEEDVINSLCHQPILFLDDLFSSRTNDNARRVILDLIDKRIDWMAKPTVISSNLTVKQISDQIDTRIASRLSAALVINLLSEEDYRIRK